jgi:trehalose 6-phosphate phosphatase
MRTANVQDAANIEDIISLHPRDVNTRKMALFLDVDGTLVDIAAAPGLVQIPERLVPLLQQLYLAFDGAVAIVTGRRIVDADRLLEPLRLPASGVHGSEFRFERDGGIVSACEDIADHVKVGLLDLAEYIPGLLIEPKGTGIAVHYRLVPSRKDEIESKIRFLIKNRAQNLIVASGRMVFEIIPVGLSKGTAIESLLSKPPFAGRTPIMIGDDAGDVPAFEAARNHGGYALKVAGGRFPRSSSGFIGPESVRQWLHEVVSLAKPAIA